MFLRVKAPCFFPNSMSLNCFVFGMCPRSNMTAAGHLPNSSTCQKSCSCWFYGMNVQLFGLILRFSEVGNKISDFRNNCSHISRYFIGSTKLILARKPKQSHVSNIWSCSVVASLLTSRQSYKPNREKNPLFQQEFSEAALVVP
jgi:hypothetical protein